MAVDGRLHSRIPEAKTENSFCLFWALQRTLVKREANLVIQKAAVDITVKVMVPGSKRKLEDSTVDNEVTVPVLTNPLPIEKHTRLVALEDMLLHKLRQKESDQKEKAGEKVAKKSKK